MQILSADEVTERIIDVLRSGTLKAHPWRYMNVENALPEHVATFLADQFDRVALMPCEKTEGAKTYRFRCRELSQATGELPMFWRSMAEKFGEGAYCAAMSELTRLDLRGSRVALNLWEYRSDDWLSPHIDKPDKLVTQLIYLTRGWRPGDGGRLLIMESDDPASTVDLGEPRAGSTSVLVRSRSSWHAVERVASGGGPRRSLSITFRKSGAR